MDDHGHLRGREHEQNVGGWVGEWVAGVWPATATVVGQWPGRSFVHA